MRPMFLILFLLTFSINYATCAKIIFTFFHDSGSHFGSMKPLMNSLALQGHQIAIFYTISTELPKLDSPDVRIIHAPIVDDLILRESMARVRWRKKLSWLMTDFALQKTYAINDARIVSMMTKYGRELKELIDEDWDLVVIDDLFWCLGFGLTVLKYQLWERGIMGNEPRFLVFSTGGQTLMSAESVKSTVENFFLSNIATLGVPNFSWYELYRRSSLQFTDSLDRLGWPLAIGSEVVGLGANCKNGKELSGELKQFVEDPKSKGTIYVAFGTYTNWNYAPKHIIDAFVGAFNRLTEYQVIFVYNGSPIPVKSHVKLTQWVPQPDILAHPKTLAFISHRGMKSIKEGICGPVPLVVMPIFAEQAHNAHMILALGIGPVINKFTITEDSVYRALDNILSNSDESKKRASRLKRIFLDRPMPAMDEGIFAIDRLLRRKQGRRINFSRHGMHLSWPEFLFFEPILVFILLIVVSKQ